MTDTLLPRWSVRLDAERKHGFGDILPVVANHFRAYESLSNFLGPYNARQRSSTMPYASPSKELLEQMVKRGNMNYFSYSAMIQNAIKFCETTKGNRALPYAHPTTIHSIQLPLAAFELKKGVGDETLVYISGVDEPMSVKGLRNPAEINFVIVRPKLGSLGSSSTTRWEILFFKNAFGYIPEWVDSSANPRHVGKF